MILHPSVIALLVSSLLIGIMVLYSALWGMRILREWNLASGSGLQLGLERRTYLISTVLNYVFGFQIVSLFLFIYTADSLRSLFTGAMCAAGTLNVNWYGYPLLILKIVNFMLSGLWLVMNHADTKAHDYPLIKKKYAMLLIIAPFIVAECVLQYSYFAGLKADVITSCCGSIFGSDRYGVASDMAALPSMQTMTAYYAVMALTVAVAVFFHVKQKGGYLFGALSLTAFLVSLVSIISFVSVYIYELPTHHCPFCIIQGEYGHIGYLLYFTLFGAALSGMGAGMLTPFRSIPSMTVVLPLVQRRLTKVSIALYSIFIITVTMNIVLSELRL